MEQRLIDANALRYHMGVNQDDEQIFYVTDEDIDAAPTIDPENLRPKGHWESPSKLLNIVNCTACKTTFPGDFDEFRYCPCCGCFMENKNGGNYEISKLENERNTKE